MKTVERRKNVKIIYCKKYDDTIFINNSEEDNMIKNVKWYMVDELICFDVDDTMTYILV